MSIQPAIDLLREIRLLHDDLIKLAELKRQIIIQNQTDELMKITKKESKMIKKVQELDHSRRLWVAQYLNSKNFPVQYTITVSEFSKYVFQPEEKKALLEEQHHLLQTINKLKQINDTNQLLIQEAIKFLDFSIDLFATSDEEIIYKNPNQQSAGVGKSSIFDSKA